MGSALGPRTLDAAPEWWLPPSLTEGLSGLEVGWDRVTFTSDNLNLRASGFPSGLKALSSLSFLILC